MKKFISFVIIFLLFTIVEAKTLYSNVPDFSNDYIKRMSQSQRYFVTKNSKYGFTSKAVENSKFKTGGLLNESEFNIVGGSRSYLFNGLTFFTMTEGSGKVKTVDPTASGGISELSTSSGVSGVRVTNYIRSGVNVEGYGSRVSPWKVSEKYVVTFKYDDTKITVRPTSTTVTKGGYAVVDVLPTTQYTYKPQTTCGTIEDGKLRISGITKDIVCEIEHTLRNYTVTIEAGKSKYGEEAVFDNSIGGQGWELNNLRKQATQKVPYNDKISNLPTSSQVHLVGYELNGWAENNVAINPSTYKVTKDSVITAVQKQRTFEITYVPHRGTMSITKKQVTYDEKYSVGGSLSTPTAPVGYTFAGWRLGSETGNPINDDTIVKTASNHELHAIWSANKHTLTADANGGTMSATSGWTLGSGNTTATKTVTYDSQYGTLPTPTWSGHTFEGWHLGSVSGDKITSNTIMKTDSKHTIVAKWYINVPAPTASEYCLNPTYDDTLHTIVSEAPEGFTWQNHKQTDAGTYIVTAKINTGYIWGGTDFEDKHIECKIKQLNITVIADNQSKVYDGTELKADTTCTADSNLISGHKVVCTSSGSQTNAGSSTKTLTAVTIKKGDKNVTNNYNITKGDGTLTVTRKNTTLKLSPTSGTLTYGTNATVTITTDGDGQLSCKSSNENVATCSINTSTLKLTVTPKANPADGQTATITVSQGQGTNYKAATANYAATVNRKSIDVPSSPSAKTYNGSDQNSGITCPTGSTAGGEQKGKNVKEYTQTCTANSGYKFGSSDSCEVKWKIIQREVEVTAPTVKSGTLTYNENNQTIAGSAGSCSAGGTMYYYTTNYTTTSAPTFSTSSGWSTTYPSNASGKNVGTYYMWYYCYVSDTTNNKAKSGSTINTALSVTKSIGKATAVAPTLSNTTVTYDGTRKYISESGGTSGLTKEYAYRKNSSSDWSAWGTTAGYHGSINVSTYQFKARVIGNDNYKDSAESNVATLTVNAKSVSVTWGTTTTFTYNGSAQGPTASVTTGVSGETMTVTRTTSTNVGSNLSSTASCSSVSGGQEKCSNYTLTNNTKSYSIGAKSVSVTWGSTTSFTYNGSAQAPTVSATTGVSGETMTVTRTTSTNAGSNLSSTASCSSVSGGQEKCSNYTLTNNTKSYSIGTKSVSVTWTGSTSFTYNGNEQGPTASVSATGVSGETMTITNSKSTDAGDNLTSTATCSSVSGGQKKCSNYTLTDYTKKYSIAKANSSITCKTGLVYNKTEQTLATGSGCKTLSNNKRTNAGSQDVSCTGDSNHNDSVQKCSISKASCSVSVGNSSSTVTYGGGGSYQIARVTSTCDGTLSCSSSNTGVATCSISSFNVYVGPKALNADNKTTTLTITAAETTNYTGGSTTISLTVNRSDMTCPSSPSNKEYTGSSQASGISCPTGSTTEGTTSATDVGTYTQSCKAKDGYKFNSACNVTWKIVPKTCPAGYYTYTNGFTPGCAKCPPGSISTTVNSETCYACQAGEYQDKEGQTSCKKCAAGTYSYANSKSCTACPEGTYSDKEGTAKSCTACAAGTYASGTGNKSCTQCAAGSYSNKGASSCTKCPAGQYNTGKGNSSCKKCDAGDYASGTGNTSCSECGIGTYSGEGASSCTQCAAGKYASGNGNTSCSNCPAGKYSNKGAGSCTKCSAGTYSSSAGSSSCTKCPAGKYASGTGNTGCSCCSAGQYAYGQGNSSCKSCASGYTSSKCSGGCTKVSSGGGGGCFTKGTKVKTLLGYKAINELSLGEEVLTYNEELKINEYKKIVDIFTFRNMKETLYTVTLDNNEQISATHLHRIYVKRNGVFQYFRAEEVRINDKVLFADGTLHNIIKIDSKEINQTVYNLQLEENNNFYVGDNGVLVHNMFLAMDPGEK